jgi:hypothetical protein
MKKIYLCSLVLLTSGSLVAQTTTRLPLVEGLTSNTCGPCASWNGSYGPIIENNMPNDMNSPGIAVLKYQMDWPSPGTDPSFNDDANTRQGFYSTSGIPDWWIDGIANDGTQSQIDTRKATDAELFITSAYTVTGTTITVTVRIVPLVNLGSGNRLYIALANQSYSYSGGTNGETQFKHVVRKMLPNGSGTYLPALVANDTTEITQTYTYTVATGTPVQGSYDLWNSTFEVVAWVQKTTGTRQVQNASVAKMGSIGIEEGDNDEFGLVVFPNPGDEQSTVLFDAENENCSVVIFNNLGQVVFTREFGILSGRQRIEVDLSAFANGLYHVRIQSGQKTATSQLVIAR